MNGSDAEKNVIAILREHENKVLLEIEELRAKMAWLRDRLAQRESELIRVKRALIAAGDTEAALQLNMTSDQCEGRQREDILHSLMETLRTTAHANLKIKELLVLALLAFEDGASPAELKDKIETAYGRILDAGSVRPNLGRLRDDGVILRSIPPKWILHPAAAHYLREGNPWERPPSIEPHLGTMTPDEKQAFWSDPLIKKAVELAWREDDEPQPQGTQDNPIPAVRVATAKR